MNYIHITMILLFILIALIFESKMNETTVHTSDIDSSCPVNSIDLGYHTFNITHSSHILR